MLVGAGTTSARRRAGTRFPYTAHPYLCPAFHARRWYARLSLHPSAGKDWYVFLLAANIGLTSLQFLWTGLIANAVSEALTPPPPPPPPAKLFGLF